MKCINNSGLIWKTDFCQWQVTISSSTRYPCPVPFLCRLPYRHIPTMSGSGPSMDDTCQWTHGVRLPQMLHDALAYKQWRSTRYIFRIFELFLFNRSLMFERPVPDPRHQIREPAFLGFLPTWLIRATEIEFEWRRPLGTRNIFKSDRIVAVPSYQVAYPMGPRPLLINQRKTTHIWVGTVT